MLVLSTLYDAYVYIWMHAPNIWYDSSWFEGLFYPYSENASAFKGTSTDGLMSIFDNAPYSWIRMSYYIQEFLNRFCHSILSCTHFWPVLDAQGNFWLSIFIFVLWGF